MISFQSRCSHSFILALSGGSRRISSPAPSHLSSATFLSSSICTFRIASNSFENMSNLFYDPLQLIVALSGGSIRISSRAPSHHSLATSHSSLVSMLRFTSFSLTILMFADALQLISLGMALFFHIDALSGGSTRISSLAPSHLNSASSRRAHGCTLKVASFLLKILFLYLMTKPQISHSIASVMR